MEDTTVIEPREHDVLCGHGGQTHSRHVGDIKFRQRTGHKKSNAVSRSHWERYPAHGVSMYCPCIQRRKRVPLCRTGYLRDRQPQSSFHPFLGNVWIAPNGQCSHQRATIQSNRCTCTGVHSQRSQKHPFASDQLQ